MLVDDRENHRAAYEEAGVVFVHHRNAEDSLRQLAKIFPSVKAPEGADQAAAWRSTFSTHSGQNTGSRLDQPGAVAALSLIDWSRIRRRSG